MPDPTPRAPRRRPGLALPLALVAAALVAVAVVLALDPFGEDPPERGRPDVLRSLRDLSEFRAASGTLRVEVERRDDTPIVPDFLKGESTRFEAVGTVDAAVDFGGMGRPGAVAVSEDRRAVTLTLPAPHLTPARLDVGRSRVIDRDRGIIDRVGDALSDDDRDAQRELYALAEARLRAAAAADTRLLETARRNTRTMLEGLLRGLGFERITIRFRPPQV